MQIQETPQNSSKNRPHPKNLQGPSNGRVFTNLYETQGCLDPQKDTIFEKKIGFFGQLSWGHILGRFNVGTNIQQGLDAKTGFGGWILVLVLHPSSILMTHVQVQTRTSWWFQPI